MKRFRMELTYANVISTLALFLAVAGGGAFAASAVSSSTPNTLKLCAARKSGNLRLLSGRGSCKASERAVTVDSHGATGAPGPSGPAGAAGPPGERGPAGPAGASLASPDGRFGVVATDAGIVLTGPGGSVTFNGRELSSDGDLQISAAQKLVLINGTALEISSGASASLTTGGTFTQTVGGAYDQLVGKGYEQNVQDGYTQVVGGPFEQSVEGAFKQRVNGTYADPQVVGGPFEQSVEGAFKQRVNGTYAAQSGGTAVLTGSSVQLGGASCPAAAARVGSEVNGFLLVTAVGSSSKVFVC